MEQGRDSQTPSGQTQPSNSETTPSSGATPGSSTTTQPQGTTRPASGSTAAASAQNSKRRRGLGIVTPNACTECRKKRAKCDGNKPCGRCKLQTGVECVYEIPIRQSKETLRTEIEQLRYRQRSSDQVFAALVRPKLCEDVLTRLRNGQSVETISDWLGTASASGPPSTVAPSHLGDDSTSIADYGPDGAPSGLAQVESTNTIAAHAAPGVRGEMGQSSPWPLSSHSQPGSTRSNSVADAMSWTPDVRDSAATAANRPGDYWSDSLRPDHMSEPMPRYRGIAQVLSPLSEAEMLNPSGTWTNMTADINLVHHLLALYFCWEYPTFASLSKEHFLRDFQNGRQRFCSPMLVNALLALGCRFSTQPMTRESPNDSYTSGDHFFKEALRLYNNETDHHSLTTIQALGIMAIREASSGRDSESWYYGGQSQRLALEMGLNDTHIHDEEDDDELAVRAATFWGAFALDHAWSLATGSLPQSSFIPHLPMKPSIIADIEASLWVPYTDDGAPLQRSAEQPSNVRSVYKCFCELSELVHKSLYVLHSPGQPLTARVLLNIYTQYLNWYDRIPEVLRLGHNFTPAVLFAHMYYHFAILLLFRPLIKLQILGSKVAPRDVCLQAADAIQRLLTSYSQLYTLRLTPTFVPYFVLTATIMRLAIGATRLPDNKGMSDEEQLKKAAKLDPQAAKALQQGIEDLTEMVPCHHFAEQALNILRYLAKKWDVEVVTEAPKTYDPDNRYVPYSTSLNFFAPNVVTEDFIGRWGSSNVVSHGGSVSALQRIQRAAESIENETMWPFPIQGRNTMPVGEELEKAGFSLI